MSATELFDKHLHQSFLDTLERKGYVTRDEKLIQATPMLFQVEAEARALLTEHTRHAILAASRSVLNSASA